MLFIIIIYLLDQNKNIKKLLIKQNYLILFIYLILLILLYFIFK